MILHHCQEIGIINDRRYILCFNPQLFKDQCNSREERLSIFSNFINNLNKELTLAKKSRDEKVIQKKIDKQISKLKLNNYTGVSLKKKIIEAKTKKGDKKSIITYQAIITSANNKQKIAVEKLDGFWLLVTNHTEKEGVKYKLTLENAVKPYREKVIIESSFRDIKSFIKVSPVYVWTEKHVKAHFTICVLAHFLNRILTMRLHAKQGDLTIEIITHEKLYELLSDYEINKIHVNGKGTYGYKLTLLDNKAKEILERLNINKILKYNKTINNYKD
ncbi:MAG: hypothetical protein K8S23_12725 [Candidatus Cloacimonetes bacterium]|nr:hypothetical protein [Candidatus Cloacimonadota bacterium]